MIRFNNREPLYIEQVVVMLILLSLFYLSFQPVFEKKTAQSECNRADFAYLDNLAPPGPTPLENTQPTLATLNQAFDTEATSREISSWVLKAIAHHLLS